MMELLKSLKLDKQPNIYKFIIAVAIFILLALQTPLLQKLLEKPPAPTVNSSNTGVEKNSGILNRGVDSRTATTNIVGDNNQVTSNSDSNANK